MARNRPNPPGSAPTIKPAGGGGGNNGKNNKGGGNNKKKPPLAPLPKTGILPALGISGSQWRKTKNKGRQQMQNSYAEWLKTHDANGNPLSPGGATGPPVANGTSEDDLKHQRQLRQTYMEQNIGGIVDLQAQQHGSGFYSGTGGGDFEDWLKNEYLPQQAQNFMGTYDPNQLLAIDNQLNAEGDYTPNPTNINDITKAIGDQVSPLAARQAYLGQHAARFSQPSSFMNPTGRWSWWD